MQYGVLQCKVCTDTWPVELPPLWTDDLPTCNCGGEPIVMTYLVDHADKWLGHIGVSSSWTRIMQIRETP